MVADPLTGVVMISLRDPDRLAVVNNRTLKVHVRAAPGEGRHLILAKRGGPVLLPAEDKATLYRLALPSGRVTGSTPVLDHPHNAAVVGHNIWVADEFAPAVSIIGPTGRVIATLHGPLQPGGVVTAAGTVGVTDVRGARMYFYNATTFVAEGSIPLGAGPTHAIAIGGRFAVAADTRGGALLLLNMATRRIVDRLAMPGGPYGLASDPGRHQLWVTLTASNELVRVSTVGSTLRVEASTPTVQQPNTVAVNPRSGCVYVVGTTLAQLEVSCPR